MAQREIITDDHIFWTMFRDVGHHEAAGLLYIADTLWTIWDEYKTVVLKEKREERVVEEGDNEEDAE